MEINLSSEFLSDQIVTGKKRAAKFIILVKEEGLRQESVKIIDLAKGEERSVREVENIIIAT